MSVATEPERRVKVDAKGDFVLCFPFDPELVDAVKKVPGRVWDKKARHWKVPAASLKELGDFVKANGFAVGQEVAERARQVIATRSENLKASKADDATVAVPGLGGELRPFQRAGVAYATRARRCFIADEMGLGKTVQALATVQATGSYPALIVCPASLKLNWAREAAHWLPGHKTGVISGTKPDFYQYRAELVVINYDILAAHEKGLATIPFKGVIFDEGHYLKGHTAQRTKSAKALAKKADVVLILSGTPVLNAPEELVSPLGILRRLDEFGGFWHFMGKYCGYTREGGKVGPPAYLEELHRKLRESCYVRRRKADVLKELPPKTRAIVPIAMDSHREYEQAVETLSNWLSKQTTLEGFAEAQAKTELDRLKGVIALGKVKSIVAWVEDFIESGEKLVLFAYHKAVQRKLYEALAHTGAVHIFAEDKSEERQAAVDRFQKDSRCRLIVCSLMAAGAGITLTAASNVAFAEMGWTPGLMDQATDRVHRIGQVWPVTAWYLLAPGTVDDDVYELIEKKRKIVDAATDGEAVDQVPVVRELLDVIKRRRG